MTIENNMFEEQKDFDRVETRELPKPLQMAVKYPEIHNRNGDLVLSRSAFSPDQFKALVADQVKIGKVNGQDRILWEFKPVDLRLATGRAVDSDDTGYIRDRVGGPYSKMHGILTRMAVLEKTLDLGKDDPKLLKKTDQNRFERELFGLKLSLAKNQVSQDFSLAALPRVEAIYPEKSKEGVKGSAAGEEDTPYDKLVKAVAHPFVKNPASGSGAYIPTQTTVISSPAEVSSKKSFNESERGSMDLSFSNTLGGLVVAGTTVVIALSACTKQEIPPAVTDVVTGTDVSGEVASTSTEIPGFIPKTETPSAVVSTPSENAPNITPTSTQEAPVIEVAPYPSASGDLVKDTTLSGVDAEAQIGKYPEAKQTLQDILDWYTENGLSKGAEPVFLVLDLGSYWNVAVKTPDGHFYKFYLTSGPEAGQLVRDMGLINYVYQYDENGDRYTFRTEELQNPSGYESAEQRMIGSKDGWHVVGLFSHDDKFLGWFNADAPGGGKWVVEAPVTTPTPEGPMVTFASFEGVTHDAAGYHITVGDSQRVIDVAEASAEQQIVFDEEMSLYKIYDAEGNISAEYDPGQGVEGDLDYVPATGWVDIQKLAEDLLCKEGNGETCMTNFDSKHVENSVLIEMSSSNVYRYVDVKDSSSGEILGKDLLLQMISRDINSNSIYLWILIQSVPTSTPGINNISSMASFFMDANKIYGMPYKGMTFPIEQYTEWVKKGSIWSLSFSKEGRSYKDWSHEDKPKTYDAEIIKFINSGGVNISLRDIILVYNGGKLR